LVILIGGLRAIADTLLFDATILLLTTMFRRAGTKRFRRFRRFRRFNAGRRGTGRSVDLGLDGASFPRFLNISPIPYRISFNIVLTVVNDFSHLGLH
jgi:hypothetical protein